MRWQVAWLLMPAGLLCGPTWARQEPSAQSGIAQPAPPTPDKNGIYTAGPGIVSPELIHAVAAAYPPGADQTDLPRIVRFTAVIGADGTVQTLDVIQPGASGFEDAAAAAVKQSAFAPGTLNGTPVPVRVCVRVPFFRIGPPTPRLQRCPEPGSGGSGRPSGLPPGSTPPRPIYQPIPEYSNEARKKRIQGSVILSTLVNEQGVPTDIRIEKSLGYGLDEKAVQCVSRYRFHPATRPDGTPLAVRISIETTFRLY
jgi:TonB family protein